MVLAWSLSSWIRPTRWAGRQQTISAPTSIVFRRRGSDRRIVLIHTVPLPQEA